MKLLRSFLRELTVHEVRVYGLGDTKKANKKKRESPGEIEQNAFDAIKELISTKCMGYFRKDWETELISDASPVGLGAVICQFNPS